MTYCKDCEYYTRPLCELIGEFTARKNTCKQFAPKKLDNMKAEEQKGDPPCIVKPAVKEKPVLNPVRK